MRAVFNMYDRDGDGFITVEEMGSYLASIFRVLYETAEGTAESMGVGADELGRITAEQCFEEAE